MKKISCPNCQSSGTKVVLDVSKEADTYLDYLKIDYKAEKRFYVKCNECSLIYRNPILDKKEKKLLYERFRDVALRGEDKYEYFQRISSLPPDQSENYEKCVFLNNYLKKSGSILDVGCGAGVFLHAFKKYFSGWETLGVEPTTEFAEVAKKHGINIIYGYLKGDTIDKRFDLITLIHVLEHLDNVKEMLSMAKNYLKPDGLLYIEVPSAKDIGYLPDSHDRFMCQHDVIFSKNVLENILKESGYAILASDDFISVRNRNNLRILAGKMV